MPLFTQPTDISGCYCWYNAGAITGIANGSLVSNWNDSSGSGNALSGGVGSVPAKNYQPTYYTNVINGQPAVWFAQQSGSYLGTAFTGAPTSLRVTDGVWFSVYKTQATGIQCFFSQEYGGAGFFPTLLHGHVKPSGWSVATGSNAGPTFVDSIGIPAVTGEFLIRCDRRNGGFQQFIKNGAIYASGLWGTAPSEATTPNGIYIGGNFNLTALVNASGLPWSGHIAEVIGYSRQLSNSEIDQVTTYLMFKYFISSYGTNLYTAGDISINKSTTLYTGSSESINSGVPLFLYNVVTASSFPLYIAAITGVTQSTSLYTGSSLTSTSGASLYTGSTLTVTAPSPLYLLNIGYASGSLPLYIGVTSHMSGFRPMYMSGVGHSVSNFNLFLKQTPARTGTKSTTLFIPVNTVAPTGGGGGSSPGSFYKASPLYIKSVPSRTMPLYLKGPAYGTSHVDVPLFLKNIAPTPSSITNHATLFASNNNQTVTLAARLFIEGAGFNGTGGTGDGGFDGGLLGQAGMPLFIERPNTQIATMFIKNTSPVNSGMSMYVKAAKASSSPLFIKGGANSQNGHFTLFMPTPSSVFNSVNLCIPKTFADAPLSTDLYVHGF